MKNFIKSTLLTVALFASFFVMGDYALTGSDVHISTSTNECVTVKNWDGALFKAGNYSCDNMPETYTVIWVK